MKAVLLAALIVATSACAADPVKRAASSNSAMKVDLLTEFDGVRVYRFLDAGEYIYIAVSGSQLSAQWNSLEGKAIIHHDTQTVQR